MIWHRVHHVHQKNCRLDFDWRLHPVQISEVQFLEESLRPAGTNDKEVVSCAQPLNNTFGLGVMRGAFSEENFCFRDLSCISGHLGHGASCRKFETPTPIDHPVTSCKPQGCQVILEEYMQPTAQPNIQPRA